MADKNKKDKNKKENLPRLKLSDLRKIVVKLGMSKEDAKVFDTKKPLIATIKSLRAGQVVKVQKPGELKKEAEKYLSKKERIRAILIKQKSVRILIPCQGEEKPGKIEWMYNKATKRKEQVHISGAYTPVQINGWKWLVPHGMYVDVPQQVADMVSDAQNMTAQAGKAHLIDRIDPKTGNSISDRLEI